jgi:hypothetical protein
MAEGARMGGEAGAAKTLVRERGPPAMRPTLTLPLQALAA